MRSRGSESPLPSVRKCASDGIGRKPGDPKARVCMERRRGSSQFEKETRGKGNPADRPRGKPAWAELRRRENTAETAEDSVFLPTLFSFPHPKMWKKWITWNSLGQDGGNPFQEDLSRAFNLPLIRSLSAILPYKIFTQASDLVF